MAPERDHRRGAVAGTGDLHRRIRPHHRPRDLDRRRLQGISPPAPLHRQRCAGGAARPSRRRKTRKARGVPRRARHVAVVIRGQSEDLIDSWLRAKGIERRIALVVPGYIEALHVAARTDLVAFVPRRLIGALCEAIVAGDGDPAVRSRDRRAVLVLSDPRPDGPGLDLAAQHDARHRPRDGAGEGRVETRFFDSVRSPDGAKRNPGVSRNICTYPGFRFAPSGLQTLA